MSFFIKSGLGADPVCGSCSGTNEGSGTCTSCQGSGCDGHCYTSDGSCTDCTGDCTGRCNNCYGCGGDCDHGCTHTCSNGCRSCDGCSGCDSTCYGCDNTCSGRCTDSCNNGCTGEAMSEAYRKLQTGLHRLIMADDVNTLKALVNNELTRRKIEVTKLNDVTIGTLITEDIVDNIYENIRKTGTAVSKMETMPNMDLVNKYAEVARLLYESCIPAK